MFQIGPYRCILDNSINSSCFYSCANNAKDEGSVDETEQYEQPVANDETEPYEHPVTNDGDISMHLRL